MSLHDKRAASCASDVYCEVTINYVTFPELGIQTAIRDAPLEIGLHEVATRVTRKYPGVYLLIVLRAVTWKNTALYALTCVESLCVL